MLQAADTRSCHAAIAYSLTVVFSSEICSQTMVNSATYIYIYVISDRYHRGSLLLYIVDSWLFDVGIYVYIHMYVCTYVA